MSKIVPTWRDSDRVALTPAGAAALAAADGATLPEGCPQCGSALGAVNLYCGGRGYVSYDACTSPECEYQRKADSVRKAVN